MGTKLWRFDWDVLIGEEGSDWEGNRKIKRVIKIEGMGGTIERG
jgi:hypothetical protein